MNLPALLNSSLPLPSVPLSPLYASLPSSTLSTLTTPEKLWVTWYSLFDNPVLATGIMSFLMHEVVYFGRCIPWLVIENIKFFDKYRLQPGKTPTAKQQWECTKKVLAIHFTVELPQIYLFHPMAESVGMKTWQVPFPSLWTIAWQILLFSVLEDAWHYWVHRLAHHRLLYKHVHKIHHEYSAPFGLAAEYAHPVETLVLGAGTVLAPLGFCWASGGGLHLVTMYLWIIFRLLQAVDSHSGYDFPWSLNNCYSSSYTHLDWLFGTDRKYRSHRAAQKAEKERKAKSE
ncbi:hypothetical protein MNV49_005376 [Pseudohyphozyma bogoriensis]|nr:hypothetical protein MNV49_005376 [Pseudohyphozyma bogoriensis]